ncbi:MAG: ATP-dependent 6-phosphofructokinase [Victivallaceae bacterium]|nr:ATP-dependent 6-phosphofructokinase [Victivallaceae bacterium]
MDILAENFRVTKLGEAKLPTLILHTNFIDDDARVSYYTNVADIASYVKSGKTLPSFEEAGPRRKIFHDPRWSRAAILTAGGLCPGLNDVIKFLTRTLIGQYHVPMVYGIRYGYRGLIPSFGHEPLLLNMENVDDLHESGGSLLGSSRGRQDENEMVDTLVRMNINMLFCIGGDGTLRCAHDVARVISKRKLGISVIGIPKTIDNDISFIDKSFGFETAVYMTGPFVTAAHNEAKGAYNGIGLVKVMGRDSGFIAAYATLGNSYINFCLIPEKPFTLEGKIDSFLPMLERRIKSKHHAVIIAAEGAGQDLFDASAVRRDASGNVLHNDIGLFLKEKIDAYFKARDIEVNLKYFDPSYTIRSMAAQGTDAVFCSILAQNAVHAAMAGCTDIVLGHWHERFTHVPIALAVSERRKIDTAGQLWSSVSSTTWSDLETVAP